MKTKNSGPPVKVSASQDIDLDFGGTSRCFIHKGTIGDVLETSGTLLKIRWRETPLWYRCTRADLTNEKWTREEGEIPWKHDRAETWLDRKFIHFI